MRQHIGASRFVYNWALEKWNKWVEDKKNGLRSDNPNWVKLSKIWTVERPDWAIGTIPRHTVEYTLRAVNMAFTAHFKSGAGWPKFKKRGKCNDAFRLSNSFRLIRDDGVHIHIQRVPGVMRMAEKLRLSGKILGYTVSVYGDRWYVGVQVEVADTRSAPLSVVGVDVGMKTPAVCSDGTTLTLPEERLQRLDKRLRLSQRRLSRSKDGSRRRVKALIRKQRIQARINNIRQDYVHKFTSAVCKNHATVVIEDLVLIGMHAGARNVRSGMAKSCMCYVHKQLSYKAMRLVVADKLYPSSQLCSKCGTRHKIPLTTRIYRCDSCGTVIDRDLNAAINLSKYPGSQG